ncbi:erythromycin esterase family protein [Nocardia pseudobrasiliensis]|uniref:Erythromycin esterase-like protein n=1 Tax=Nocardia pseudobrasiliensis TaxID=45979 RepID=A0A370HPK0_9NOCA|nr:erythromycin esterase family protein [Nocardia pseudobrasiliensis]RDI60469.1 erythromycin esterase-like protein [Nocardia pseudobrasiliensis]
MESVPVLRDTPQPIFRDRREAGRVLAGLLEHYRGDKDVIVLGLARGGVPVAWEVAADLDAPLDALVVRKLGAPGNPECAIGAIAPDGRIVVNDDMIRGLHLTAEQVRSIARTEAQELSRRQSAYTSGRARLTVAGKTVILVDDGLATGATMFAAVEAIRAEEPKRIVIAVPAAPESTCREFGALVDEMVCATMPSPFLAVGAAFWNFAQVTDDEVRRLLATPTIGARPAVLDPVAAVREAAIDAPSGVPPEDVLDDLIGDAHFVLLGESSHGTHEFYAARAAITRWLIAEKGFDAVAAEADWPDAYRLDRFVRGFDRDSSPGHVLLAFERFPAWMWRNTVVRDFVGWLRLHNDVQRRIGGKLAGFYGLDLYSMHRSMQQVITYLEQADPAAAERARRRYASFDRTSGNDGQAYGFAAAFGAGESCEAQVVRQLVDLQRNAAQHMLAYDGEAQFDALRNAWTVRDAEAYYRAMFGDRVSSWNLRDEHMAGTLDALANHFRRDGKPARIVVWAHNSHIGDARATEMAADGQLSLGQLVRERHGNDCRIIGFSTCHGTVTAATRWGGDAERKKVRNALPSSYEELLHDTGRDSFLIRTDTAGPATDALRQPRLERAIGVIYQPGTERQSHYFHSRLADRYDAIIHIDHTSALKPVAPSSSWMAGTTPETYPTGL